MPSTELPNICGVGKVRIVIAIYLPHFDYRSAFVSSGFNSRPFQLLGHTKQLLIAA